MNIRKASFKDLAQILDIYARAREFQKNTGNPTQWAGGYPQKDLLEEDLVLGRLYVCADGEEILGVFVFFIGDDETYRIIRNGRWLNDEPYGVIHRIASSGKEKGVARFCFQWALSQCENLRIDTHADNTVMQHVLQKNGFLRCGEITAADGTPRIAFQKTARSA